MKKFLKIGFVAVFAAVAGYGVYANQTSVAMSDLALANVEALARGEGPDKYLTVKRIEYSVADENGDVKKLIMLDCKDEHPLGYDCV